MKFKIGDKVRLTREAIYSPPEETDKDISHLMEGDRVVGINDRGIILSYKDYTIYNPDLFELVPEESEFGYGEIIEVSNDKEHWLRRMFIAKSNSGKYMGIDCSDENGFVNGRNYMVGFYKYARKLKPQLTRKEIAEKFGVSEDFTLVD